MSDVEVCSSLVLRERIKYLPDNEIILELKHLINDQNHRYFRVDKFFNELKQKKSVLIDLFLAEYLTDKENLSLLFKESHNKAVKYLILKNPGCYRAREHFLCDQELISLLEDEDFGGAIALNPSILKNEIKLITSQADKAADNNWKNNILSNLYYLVLNKSENTFLRYDGYFGIGYVHYLWRLFETLPVDPRSVVILEKLLETSLNPNYVIIDTLHEMEVARTVYFGSSPVSIESIFDRWSGKDYFELRISLSEKIVRCREQNIQDDFFVNSEDLAVRIGYYRSFSKSDNLIELMDSFYLKDGPHFIQAILDGQNDIIFREKGAYEKFQTWLSDVKGLKISCDILWYSPNRYNDIFCSDRDFMNYYFFSPEISDWIDEKSKKLVEKEKVEKKWITKIDVHELIENKINKATGKISLYMSYYFLLTMVILYFFRH